MKARRAILTLAAVLTLVQGHPAGGASLPRIPRGAARGGGPAPWAAECVDPWQGPGVADRLGAIPPNVDRAALAVRLGAQPSDERTVSGLGLKPWSRVPGTWVAVMEEEIRKKSQTGATVFNVLQKELLRVAVLTLPADGQPVIVAESPEIDLGDTSLEPLRLDFAAYRLTEQETAFGLCVCGHWGGVYSDSDIQQLWLFRQTGSALERILDTPMRSRFYNYGKGDQPEFVLEHQATVRVSPDKTNGVFDLIKDAKPSPPARLTWSGSRYVLQGHDPLRDASEDAEK